MVSATGTTTKVITEIILMRKTTLSHPTGQGATAAVAAATEAIRVTLAIPGAPDGQLIMIMIDRTPEIRGAPMILIPQTTLGMPIPQLLSR